MHDKSPLFQSTKQTEYCPQCGGVLQLKRGSKGLFLGCQNYPACEYLKPLQPQNHVVKTLSETCPECGAPLQIKNGHFGLFIGCSAFPECHFTVHDDEPETQTFTCPECRQHPLVLRQGRSGKKFYGCAGYPHCRFTLAGEPVEQRCPECGCDLALRKKIRGKTVFVCANKACQQQFSEQFNANEPDATE